MFNNLDVDIEIDFEIDSESKEKLMSFEITPADYYDYGFDAGRQDAIACCFGSRATGCPNFENPKQEHAYNDGYNDGYNSIED